MAIDVKAEAEKIANRFFPEESDKPVANEALVFSVVSLVTRAVAESVKPYEEAVSAHNSKMDKVPKMETRPKTPAVGLRFLARWFDAMYPDDLDTAVQDDLRRWANEWDNAVADAKLKQMEADCKAVCVKCKFGFNSLDHSMFCQNIRTAFAATEPKIVHGLTCNKARHTRDGYLHGEDYDGPYDVDGLEYCGRCHVFMPSPATEPRDVAKDDPRQRLDKAAIARDEALEEAAIHRLVEAMRAKLAENRHKPNWRTQKASYLIDRVMQETVELHAAVINDKLPSDVWSEAADVANLAMMVADCFGAQSAARELGLDGDEVAKQQSQSQSISDRLVKYIDPVNDR